MKNKTLSEKRRNQKMKKYIILCPKCETTHDISEQMSIWRDEFLSRINKLIKDMKNEK